MSNKYSAPAAACAADVLSLLAKSTEPMSLAEIARQLKRSKSLVFRVAKELEVRDYVRETSEGRFWLGINALELGGSYLSQSDFSESARRVLRDVSDETGETVNLGQLRGSDVVYLAKWEGTNSIVTVSHVGKRIPANCTALGKALLSQLSDKEVDGRFDGVYPTLTSASLGSRTALLRELAATRKRGFAIEVGETLDGRACVGVALDAPVAGAEDGVAVSISMSARRFETDGDEMRARLLEAGKELEHEWQQRLLLTGTGLST